MTQLDENKLNAFIGKMLGDLGGAFSVPTTHRPALGLFDALSANGPQARLTSPRARVAWRRATFESGPWRNPPMAISILTPRATNSASPPNRQ